MICNGPFPLEIGLVITPASGVATRRGGLGGAGPWTEVHGYRRNVAMRLGECREFRGCGDRLSPPRWAERIGRGKRHVATVGGGKGSKRDGACATTITFWGPPLIVAEQAQARRMGFGAF
jgi:hypothetical protein